MSRQDVTLEVYDEMERACSKHPHSQPGKRDPIRSAALVGEEAGEILKAALDLTRPALHKNKQLDNTILLARLRNEIVQTAAMCHLWLQNFEETINHVNQGKEVEGLKSRRLEAGS